MKNKLLTVLNVIIVILLTFLIIASTGIIMLNNFIKGPEYCLSQVEATNTYENAYNSLMKKFKDNYSVTLIPLEVYEKTYTKEWVKNAINEQIRISFEQFKNKDKKVNTDYSAAEKNITEFFENYAHENHVIKDEVYTQKLEEAVINANKTAEATIDVYRLSTIKKAGIWNKVEKVQQLVSKVMPICIIVTVVLTAIVLFFKNRLYWLGTALFSGGCVMLIPTVYVMAAKLVMRFSVKEFTTFTLMTGTMNSALNTVMYISIALIAVGVILMCAGIVMIKRGNKNQNTQDSAAV